MKPKTPADNMAVFSHNQLQQHCSVDSCWVVLYGRVYDVTDFLPHHPGGRQSILDLAGSDATERYDPIHPPGTLEAHLPPAANLGAFDATTVPPGHRVVATNNANSSPSANNTPHPAPQTLAECLNLDDIEHVATQRLSRLAWGYFYSGGDDLVSKRHNTAVYRQLVLRPRMFVDCTRCDTSTRLLRGAVAVDVPFYVAPAALARLGHGDGERGIARACARFGALQIISNAASQTPEQILDGAPEHQVFGWQLYVHPQRERSEEMLRRVNRLAGVKFICLTLDAPVPGKREDDERGKHVGAKISVIEALTSLSPTSPDPQGKPATRASTAVAAPMFAGTAPDLTWTTTLPWLRKHTDLPIVLKGLQTHEDAYMASLHAPQVQGIILSNHGGRALDTAPPAIHTLLEIRKYCPEVLTKLDVWVDGGIKRGTDVVKALALGAKGVGIGRAPLFGLGAGGTAGVERVLEILKAETETAMRLLGVERVEQLGPQHVNTTVVERELYDGPGLSKWGLWLKSKM